MISVVIPTYNSEKTALAAIKSVLFQTYENWNIIIIDDGSQDNTFVLIDEFLKTLPENLSAKIKLLKQQNRGPSAARNLGVILSKGEYIAFLDSDDCWDKNKLEIQMKYMKNDDSLYLCATAFGRKRIKKKTDYKYISFRKLLFKNYFSTPTVLVKKKIFNQFEFDVNQRNSEDYKLWLQIAYEYKCLYINEVLASNQENKKDYGESGLSANLWKMQKGELSNFVFLYKQSKINGLLFLGCIFFSNLKFCIRLIKSKIL
ncbi:glycosyltransferase family 2 protein [Flavobacterium sp. UBA4854]|uniref:glycosyltransferase family 2 protein n=1 Tax=Flavobacterium sp. UBA4854 TaxID=1946548 RepID=UPI00257DD82D|nr:glycosyltransferase family A protein [Flavobacterium sp. UBA4854]